MFQKKNDEELKKLKTEELVAHQKELMVRKAELMQKKKDGAIADEEQAELEDLAVYLVAVGKLVAAAQKPAEQKPAAQKPAEQKPAVQKPAEQKSTTYTPLKGEENIAVLRLAKGHRFDPNTGKRLTTAPSFLQKFNSSEYQLFMKYYESLGYVIEEVVYNPFK